MPSLLSEFCMKVSTSVSHFSMFPLALRFLPSETYSPSPDFMPKMSVLLGSSPKSRLLIPSNHFDM